MEKNDLLPENSLIKKLKNRLNNNKKSLIRLMAGLGASAMLLTGVACDETHTYEDTTDNSPIIDKETDYINDMDYHTSNHIGKRPVETEPLETEPIETIPLEYSDTFKEFLTSPEYSKYEKEYQAYLDFYDGKSLGGGYGLSFNPVNHEYYNSIFADNEEFDINNNCRIGVHAFGKDNDLYVIYVANKIIPNGTVEYRSLLRYDLDEKIYNDLKYSIANDDELSKIIILYKIANNYNYEVLAENSVNLNTIYKVNVDGKSIKTLTSVNGYDQDNNIKYCYSILKDNALVKLSKEFNTEKDNEKLNYFNKEKGYDLPYVIIDSEEEYDVEKIDALNGFTTYKINTNNQFKYEITP